MLDKTDDAIIAFEMEMATLAKQASLFDVYFPDFKQLKMCRKEIKMLKACNRLYIIFITRSTGG